MNFETRAMKDLDRAFIFTKWLKTYRADSVYTKRIKPTLFYKNHHKVIERILNRPTTSVYVAHIPSEPDVIVGFLATEQTDAFVIHYAFTKEPWQQEGIQKALFKAANVPPEYFITHWTNAINFLAVNRGLITYDPYRI